MPFNTQIFTKDIGSVFYHDFEKNTPNILWAVASSTFLNQDVMKGRHLYAKTPARSRSR